MDIRTSCLGVLALHPASGYEIRKMFEDGPFSIFAEGGFGSIYPALKQLERDGLVTSETFDQDTRPRKNVYEITTKGRLELIAALSHTPPPDKFKSDFLFSMFFAEYLAPTFVENTIDGRIKFLGAKINGLENGCNKNNSISKGQSFVRAFGLHMHTAAREFLEQNKHIAMAAALTDHPGGKQDAAE